MADIGQKHTFCRVGRVRIGPRCIHFLNGDLQLARHLVKRSGQITNFTRIALLVDTVGQVAGAKSLNTLFHSCQRGIGAANHGKNQCQSNGDGTNKPDDRNLISQRNSAVNGVGALNRKKRLSLIKLLESLLGSAIRARIFYRGSRARLVITLIKLTPLRHQGRRAVV